MELNITEFVREWRGEWQWFSASQMEMGERAGAITWENAIEYAEVSPIAKLPSEFEAIRDYIRHFGAWDDNEIDRFTYTELNALLIQLIAADFRESEYFDTWDQYDEQCGGHLLKSENDTWYYYVGS